MSPIRLFIALALSATNAAAQVVGFHERHDGHYVYLELDFAQPTNILGVPATLTIDVDADGKTATGGTLDGFAGTDFAIDFAPTNANGRVTEGVALRVVGKDGVVRKTDTYTLNLVMTPSYTSSHVELRLARGRMLDSTAAPVFTGSGYRARLGALPVVTAQLTPLDTTPRAQATDPLARVPGTQFRALVWNVANEGIRDRADHFRRIIAAVDPDLLVLNEVGGVIQPDGVRTFLASVDSGRSRAPWHFTYGGGGGYQRTTIAYRGDVAELPEFRFIPFPDSIVERLIAMMPPAAREKQRASFNDGVATGGALVTIAGHRVAVFGVDLQSAGNTLGSWQDARRMAETRIVRDLAGQAIHAHGPVDGVIAAGDHNLVGTREPLNIMGTIGLSFDGAPLRVAEPLHLDGATPTTWDGSGGPFPPGRLDWFSYSGAALEVRGAFVFDVGDLSQRWRAAHGLEADDSQRSSDHRPLVIDLKWTR